jgi:protein gp37
VGSETKISWADKTFNPYWGCEHVSPACDHCYAEAWAKRTGFDCFGPGKAPRTFGDAHFNEPVKWNLMAINNNTRYRVFCGSMCDIFQDRFDVNYERARLWHIIKQTPFLDWMILTKRPELISDILPEEFIQNEIRNIIIGVTAENQKMADLRIPKILWLPFRRFVSFEPLLQVVNAEPYLNGINPHWSGHADEDPARPMLDWVICGAENGPNARPTHPTAFVSLRDQCLRYRIPFHFKGWGEWTWLDWPHVSQKAGDAWVWTDGTVHMIIGKEMPSNMDGCVLMRRVGKKTTGRVMGGREWLEFPRAVQ